MLNHCFFCHQKLRKSDICVYVEPSALTFAAALAAVGAALATVDAAIAPVTAVATAAVSVAATIAISAAAIADALWLVVVFPRHCLCFCLPPRLPAPAVDAVVYRRHCHCHRHRNCCPCSFCCHRRHSCLFFCRWLRCLYLSTAAASVSIAATRHHFCFRCCCATASVSNAIATVVPTTATITDKKH
jgi:hypothetical protein